MAIRPIDMQVVVSRSSDVNARRQQVLSKQENAVLTIQQQDDLERNRKAIEVVDRSKTEEAEIQRRMKEERENEQKRKKKRENKEKKNAKKSVKSLVRRSVGAHLDMRI